MLADLEKARALIVLASELVANANAAHCSRMLTRQSITAEVCQECGEQLRLHTCLLALCHSLHALLGGGGDLIDALCLREPYDPDKEPY